MDKINWSELSGNPNAIPLLEKHMDKIDWEGLSLNPNAIHLLCPLDYEKTKEANQTFREALMEYVLHPDRMVRFASQYDMELRNYVEFY